MEDDLWIFGYGSLVWRPDFPFRERRPAFIEGWVRRFWQGSTDHRGVPGAPGRVVTLLPQADSVCWGMAYNIGGETVDATLAHLDYREKGGYQVERTVLNFNADKAVPDGLVYVATPENPNYLGPADPGDIARQVCGSHGPSGPNDEYVLKLADALRAMGVDDPHIFEIEALIRL
ncbi:MAG: gamma-glutamylcyclotransferase [Rhodospirillaceae bacterium]|jgi:glutathione-specific gamma-glutamylcyclotransferase|nr:gamma-glutamylcyclotransferase [Rhodospirillaceae bacterium]MBT5458712.1 gamma-glutamylcyclotransferase [Rhodospirillaceae bacterium]